MQDLSEFRSGADYDAQYSDAYKPEIDYLTQLAIEQDGSVLDVCCGTGIVTIPLAEKTGLSVDGIDIAEDMLAHAKIKSEHLANLSLHLANALEFDLNQHFDLAFMTGNAFQAFLNEDDILRLLKNINRHLNDNGILIFDTRLLEHYDLTTDGDFKLSDEYIDSSGNHVKYFSKKTRYDESQQILYSEMKREYADGYIVSSGIDLKFVPLTQLLSIFQKSGFELIEKYANWKLAPFDPQSKKAVFKLKKR